MLTEIQERGSALLFRHLPSATTATGAMCWSWEKFLSMVSARYALTSMPCLRTQKLIGTPRCLGQISLHFLSVLFSCWVLDVAGLKKLWATAAKIRAARQLREHQRQQYLDRTLYWGLRFSSIHDQEVLTIIIDGMGKWGTSWPHLGQDKPSKDLDNIIRPKLVITAALCHGWGTFLFGTSELENHGADPCLLKINLTSVKSS